MFGTVVTPLPLSSALVELLRTRGVTSAGHVMAVFEQAAGDKQQLRV